MNSLLDKENISKQNPNLKKAKPFGLWIASFLGLLFVVGSIGNFTKTSGRVLFIF